MGSSASVMLTAAIIAGWASIAQAQTATSPLTLADGLLDWRVAFEKLVSAVKVETKGSQTASDQQSIAWRKSAEASVSAQVQSDLSAKINEARQRQSYDTGQGYNACRVTGSARALARVDETLETVRQKTGLVDDTWIKSGGDLAGRLADSIDNRLTYYCSREEMAAGICQSERPGGYAAGDSDASVFLARRSYGSEEVLTGADYIDVVAPMPTVNVQAQDLAGRAALLNDRRRAALVSGARQALFGILLSGMEGQLDGQ
ncbi:hypothetical protein [Microvirga puerhi]|uniref:Uncharacterized protein n=1 Tax=Microvirga puerhi TaxID=2876078 RepID=A0ABS7VTP2_9HYPH|nr:hypothetical protein [Microvirga puerhi]MBZ6078929.1 hypothetical protein [Microvirga puerhi]